VGTTVLNGLGQAIRWLRERNSKKQYQVADDAGITKGMLSSYETGRQRPSLETLEKVLSTLGCDLHDLHNSLQIVNGRPQTMRQRMGEMAPMTGTIGMMETPEPGRTDIRKLLGLTAPLPPEEEKAIVQILDGFHRLLRYIHETAKPASQAPPQTPEEPASPPASPPSADDDAKEDEDDEGDQE
jgi:transcriptional regulator with XRE-family HTH domain